jgi:hypothetical protein
MSNDFTIRASYHESGHCIVALHLGFAVEGIGLERGYARTMCNLDAADRTNNERYILLAGGVAAEKLGLKTYDVSGCRKDQEQITNRGGALLEDYLPAATSILQSHAQSLCELRKQVFARLVEESLTSAMTGETRTFTLIAKGQIEQIWREHT